MRLPFEFTVAQRRAELISAFAYLFEKYGENNWEVSTTCNVILQGNAEESYSVYYGQSFGTMADWQRNVRRFAHVDNMGDIGNVELSHSLEDFNEIFFATHDDSNVSVHSIINIIIIITRELDNFDTDALTNHLKRVY